MTCDVEDKALGGDILQGQVAVVSFRSFLPT